MRDERALREVIDSLSKTLDHIQEKLKHAHVLNGGFDVLMEKITNIEDRQTQYAQQVADIHTSIYEPDKGLHARIASKAEDEVVNEIKVKVENKADEKEVEELKRKVSELEKWKSNISKIVLAGLVPLVTTFLKFMYDFAAAHVILK